MNIENHWRKLITLTFIIRLVKKSELCTHGKRYVIFRLNFCAESELGLYCFPENQVFHIFLIEIFLEKSQIRKWNVVKIFFIKINIWFRYIFQCRIQRWACFCDIFYSCRDNLEKLRKTRNKSGFTEKTPYSTQNHSVFRRPGVILFVFWF